MPAADWMSREPFSLLKAPLRDQLRAEAQRRTLPPHSTLYEQSAPACDHLWLLLEGLVELVRCNASGEDVVVDYRHAGSLLGEAALYDLPYPATARCASRAEVLVLPLSRVRQMLEAAPSWALGLLHRDQSRFDRLYADLTDRSDQKVLHRIEGFPFRHRLSEIMTAPAICCPPDLSLSEAARRMAQSRIRSLLVVDDQEQLCGILTQSDLINRAMTRDAPHAWFERLVGEVMTPHPATMRPESYMYEAMATMCDHGYRHLPVVLDGRPLGMVSLIDLMRYRSQPVLRLAGRVREAADLATLAKARAELPQIADSLLEETPNAPDVLEVISHIHHNIIRRVFALALQQQERAGQAQPPEPFCLLLMGSGGRREMLLAPDQDHALLYADVAEERLPVLEAFYQPLCERFAADLATVGYPLCEGGVMASNPLWRGRLSDWQRRLGAWMTEPEPQQARNTSIFLDFIPLVGDPALAHELQDLVRLGVREAPAFLYQMMALDLSHKVPLGLFGRFLTEKEVPHRGQISLKRSGSVYLVDCVRILALEAGIRAKSTLERLEGLVQQQVISAETADQLRMAFDALAFLRLRQEIRLIERGREPDHYLAPSRLDRNERELLRAALRVISRLQDLTRRHFSKSV